MIFWRAAQWVIERKNIICLILAVIGVIFLWYAAFVKYTYP